MRILWPVIERELRTSARYSYTYYLRVLATLAVLLQCLLFGIQHGFGPTLGGKLFGSLHYMLFGAIWLLVPFLTADCISRERREGTLGLLFLTRLNGKSIVAAKGVAHGLRALTLWVAVLPVLTIPFLLGGVTWIEALLSMAISFSSICWALSAGLLASAWSKSWLQAVVKAMLFAGVLVICFVMVVGEMMLQGTGVLLRQRSLLSSSDFTFLTGFSFIAGNGQYLRLVGLSSGQILWLIALLASFSILLLLLAVEIAGQKTKRVWQKPPPSELQLWCQRTFCTPRFWLSFFRRWMLRQIEHNPIGWLERRRWSGRLVSWSWFAVVISIYTAGLTDHGLVRGLGALQNTTAWLLAGSIAISAAGSFRRERETGVLELLLVSPLNETQIMFGRLRGLWGQFFPAFCLLFILWMYLSSLQQGNPSDGILFHLSTFLTLPVVGLYFSLRCRGFVPALVMTLAMGLFFPLILSAFLFRNPNTFGLEFRPSEGGATCVQLVTAYLFATGLYTRLKRRDFRFEQESGR